MLQRTEPDSLLNDRHSDFDTDSRNSVDWIGIEIRPNSASNRKALLVCVCFLSFSVALICIISALLGAWLVLPFAGLEIMVLAVGALLASSHATDVDSLVISRNFVHLTTRRRSNQSVTSFVRCWTRVRLIPGRTAHEPSRLVIDSQGRYRQIGEHLMESARRKLHRQLIDTIRN